MTLSDRLRALEARINQLTRDRPPGWKDACETLHREAMQLLEPSERAERTANHMEITREDFPVLDIVGHSATFERKFDRVWKVLQRVSFWAPIVETAFYAEFLILNKQEFGDMIRKLKIGPEHRTVMKQWLMGEIHSIPGNE